MTLILFFASEKEPHDYEKQYRAKNGHDPSGGIALASPQCAADHGPDESSADSDQRGNNPTENAVRDGFLSGQKGPCDDPDYESGEQLPNDCHGVIPPSIRYYCRPPVPSATKAGEQ